MSARALLPSACRLCAFLLAGWAAGRSAAECVSPAFTTSDQNGGWSNGGYYVHNNMWNRDIPLGPETLYACSYKDWYVVSNQTNSGGAVKTYPNVHKDYNNVPISSFKYLTSTFAAAGPQVGIYNVAYDIWLNGVATAGANEVMIWTENRGQVPAGNKVDSVTLGGLSYSVWKTGGNAYIAFVAASPVLSGTLDLRALLDWILAKGWIPSASTLGQICFGVEIVSTGGANAKYVFSDFTISTSPNGLIGKPGRAAAPASAIPGRAYYSLSGRRLGPGAVPAPAGVNRSFPAAP